MLGNLLPLLDVTEMEADPRSGLVSIGLRKCLLFICFKFAFLSFLNRFNSAFTVRKWHSSSYLVIFFHIYHVFSLVSLKAWYLKVDTILVQIQPNIRISQTVTPQTALSLHCTKFQ